MNPFMNQMDFFNQLKKVHKKNKKLNNSDISSDQ